MSLMWRMAFLNLQRNLRRSVATGSAIAAGFVGLSLLGCYIFAMQMGMQANMVYMNLQGHLQIHKKNSLRRFSIAPKKYLIDHELDQKLAAVLGPFASEIDFQGKFLTGAGLVITPGRSQPFLATGFERSALVRALESPFVAKWGDIMVRRHSGAPSSGPPQSDVSISLTERIVDILGLSTDLKLLKPEARGLQLVANTLQNDLNAVNAEFGSIHSTGIDLAEDTSIRVPIQLLQDLLATDGYQWLSLFLHSAARSDTLKRRLNREFESLGLPLEVFSFDDEGIGDFYIGTINFLYVIAAFFIILICTMVTLSIVNSLTLGILERAKELGTLKALGFSRSQVVGLFVRETVWLTLIAIAVGFIVSLLVSSIVNSADVRFSPPNIEGEVRMILAPNYILYGVFSIALLLVAAGTSSLVSYRKLKASAVQLLTDTDL